MRWRGLSAIAAAAPTVMLLAAAGPQTDIRLEVDPELFSSDLCLAPEFDGAGCVKGSDPESDSLPTASAALLAPDLVDPAPVLAFDASVLREGAEVTFSS